MLHGIFPFMYACIKLFARFSSVLVSMSDCDFEGHQDLWNLPSLRVDGVALPQTNSMKNQGLLLN